MVSYIVENHCYNVHSDILYACSTRLQDQMIFAIKEGDVERKLDGVKTATFDLFLQWAYRGDYVVPHRRAIPHTPKPVS